MKPVWKIFSSAILLIALASLGTPAIAQDAPKEEPKKPEMAPPPPPPPPARGADEGEDPSEPRRGGARGERGERGERGRRGGRGGRGGRGMERLVEALDLDDEQAQQLRELSTERGKAMREMMQGGNATREDFQKLQGEFAEKMKKILTPEQQKKYEELSANRRRGGRRGPGGEEGGRGRRGGRRGGQDRGMNEEQMLETVKTVLVLSETEESVVLPKVKAVIQATKAARSAAKDGQTKLLGYLKQGGTAEEVAKRVVDYRQKRDAAEAAEKAAMLKLAENLNDEQKAKLLALGLIR